MHLPDGVLPVREWLPLSGVAAGVFAAASRRARTSLDTRRIAVLGFLAAVVLVIQMVNFPLVGSTSGHLTGTTLLVFVAGPEAAAIAMASVLTLQAFAFQDGGVLALGANYLNMVVIPALIAVLAMPFARRHATHPTRVAWIAGAAAWAGSVGGALSCALQLGFADVVPIGTAVTWMGGCHALIGAVEGVLTAVVIAALGRRGLVSFAPASDSPAPRTRWISSVLALAVVAALIVPIASRRPDVLESLLGRVESRLRR